MAYKIPPGICWGSTGLQDSLRLLGICCGSTGHVCCSIEADQGVTPHASARVSLVSWEGRSHALLFMVPLGLPSARPMAQALRLPFEYYILILVMVNSYSLFPSAGAPPVLAARTKDDTLPCCLQEHWAWMKGIGRLVNLLGKLK